MTLKVIIVQLQLMDTHLDTLSDELCQVNTLVSRITQRQARLGGFDASPSSSPEASEDEDASNGDDDDEDEDASSSSDDEMMTSR